MLLACTRRRHSRHAKPHPKVILERRKHFFGSFGECELLFWPPKYCLLKTIPKTTPKPHPSCSHGAAVLQVVYKSRLQLPSHRTAVRAARRTRATCSWFWHMPWTERLWAKFSGFGGLSERYSERNLNDTRKAQKAGHCSASHACGRSGTSVKKHVMEPVGRRSSSIYTHPAFLPSCLPAFLPSCLPAFLPSSLAPFLLLLPCLPSSSALPPFLFLPSSSSLPLPPSSSSLPFSLAPSFLAPLLPGFLYPFLPILLRPFSSCFLFLPVSLPLLSSSILSLSPFHPSLT